jgi:hypothetical protein
LQEAIVPIEYFCYISRNKVDQLYQQLNPDADYELTEIRQKESTVTADAGADLGIGSIISLFRVGGTYGKKGHIQREAKIKTSYMTKLQSVTLALAKQAPIPPVKEMPASEQPNSGIFYHSGQFRVTKPVRDPQVDAVITLETNFGGRQLLLDCSLRNFSAGPQADGSFALTSANARFFKGGISLNMTTIFFLLEWSEHRVVGSPLFLKLALDSNDLMTAL